MPDKIKVPGLGTLDQTGSGHDREKEIGVLLHPTSLPSPYGIGDLGPDARCFLDRLREGGYTLWQILPLNPVGLGFSPYLGTSAFAGNPLLISPDDLVEEGLLDPGDLAGVPGSLVTGTDFAAAAEYKEHLLCRAFRRFAQHPDSRYQDFLWEHQCWLPDFTLFLAFNKYFRGVPWNDWLPAVADREEKTLDYYRRLLWGDMEFHSFVQYLFFRQWQRLREYAWENGVKIIGDIPIYVAHHSSDVWSNRKLFLLDRSGNPLVVSGVPPDKFCETGQLWGSPVYDWDQMKKDRYHWWRERLAHVLKMVDLVRLDHFRGFEAFWAVPYGEKTAERGKWIQGPGEDFFQALEKHLNGMPFIAEDLGFITGKVTALKEKFHLPGMEILQLACEAGEEELKRALQERNTVFYTGTHDNDTLLGWLQQMIAERPDVVRLLKKSFHIDPCRMTKEEICSRLVQAVYASNARRVVIPMQDLLCLDSTHRMNTPGTVEGNWCWRL